MKSDKEFNDSPVVAALPTGLTGETLRRNPVIVRSRTKPPRANIDEALIEPRTKELVYLSMREKANLCSRLMAWDNQRIFGHDPENRSSAGNTDLEAE